jgi:hypothetical protein
VNNPGFGAFAAGSPSMPAGSQALPGNSALGWDFLPMEIDSLTANLFYWDGLGSNGDHGLSVDDVDFGPLLGSSYSITLFDKSNAGFSVDGSDRAIPGGVIDNTAANGSLHRHRYFSLSSGNGSPPADGVYLFSIQLKMAGLENSLPVLLVFGTQSLPVAALDVAAIPWAEAQINVAGDYNRDGIVDAADFPVWRDSLGQEGVGLSADGDGNHIVDADDYAFWKQRFGEKSELRFILGDGAGNIVTAVVPEPNSPVAICAAAVMLLSASGRVPRAHRVLESARRPR